MIRRLGRAALALVMLACVTGSSRAATQLEARLERERIEAGSSTALLITVRDPDGAVQEPQVQVPDGLELLGTSRSQNFSWVNGKSTSEVQFRVEIAGLDAGRYSIGPIRVTVGRQTYMGGARTLVVAEPSGSGPSAAPGAPSGGPRGAGGSVGSLVMEMEPRDPYVGQLCRLTVRLIQRVDMSEDSQYESPSTPGFWTESWSDPVQYEAREGPRRVLVVERHQRLYPLAAGTGTIGRARGLVTPSSGLPSIAFGGGRPMELVSQSVPVRVRALPAGAPAGFDGGVGSFAVTWSCDRSHATADQPVTVSLDVRGAGNLPLLHTPKLGGPGYEVFGSTTDDSMAAPGETTPGRRRFSWTVLPRRNGRLEIAAPAFAWFDPAAGAYRAASLPPVELDVTAAMPGAAEADAFPAVFAKHPASPGSKPARAWALMLAGLLAGAAVQLVRRARSAPADAPERARQREWLRAVGLAHGPDFWRAADEAAAWAESRGQRMMRLREEIAAARFGGRTEGEDDLRRRLVERLGEALPAPSARTREWAIVAAAVVLALASLAFGLPAGGPPALAGRVSRADGAARERRLPAAEAEWTRVWRETRDPDVAARLAWVSLQSGQVGSASAWVVAAQQGEPRRASVRWAGDRVREAGGLVGLWLRPVPLTSWEWGILACALALGAALEWPRRRWAIPLLLLALVTAAAGPAQDLWLSRPPQRAVAREVELSGAGITLQPGQVVRVLGGSGGGRRVRAARGVEGALAPSDLVEPEAAR